MPLVSSMTYRSHGSAGLISLKSHDNFAVGGSCRSAAINSPTVAMFLIGFMGAV